MVTSATGCLGSAQLLPGRAAPDPTLASLGLPSPGPITWEAVPQVLFSGEHELINHNVALSS